jgi:hypothetical protein
MKRCTVQQHEEFLASLLSEQDLDDLMIDPDDCHAPSRRSGKEVAGVLAILDSLEQERGITQ